MKTTILFLLFVFQLNSIKAQEGALKKIKDLYYKANADNYQTHKLSMNTMQAAIGLQTTNVVFFYDAWQADPEESPYKLNHKLVKIEVSYNISASMDYKIEYLLDENEKLVFYYKKAEGMWGNSSSRYYYDNNKLIKVISKNTNENGENKDYSNTKNFKQSDLITAKQHFEKLKKYYAFFNQMVKLEGIDK